MKIAILNAESSISDILKTCLEQEGHEVVISDLKQGDTLRSSAFAG